MLFTWGQGTGRGPPVQGKPWTSSRHKKKSASCTYRRRDDDEDGKMGEVRSGVGDDEVV